MVSRKIHKIGLQTIADQVTPIALRASNGSKADREFRPAFLMNQNNDKKNKSIIAEKGLYISNREMEIQTDEGIKAITADNLVEASISYEIFNFKPK